MAEGKPDTGAVLWQSPEGVGRLVCPVSPNGGCVSGMAEGKPDTRASFLATSGRFVRALPGPLIGTGEQKRHPCGCRLSKWVLSGTVPGIFWRGCTAPVGGDLAGSGQFQVERCQFQCGVQAVQMGAFHAVGGVYSRADESGPAVHTGVPGGAHIRAVVGIDVH